MATISLWHVAAAVAIVVGAVVRLWAAQGDLWLDEIWSCALVSLVDSPWQIFTEVRHDNNHHLISLWIQSLGAEVRPLIVRAPSIFAGVGTVALAAAWGRRWGTRAMLLATVLTASSYVMINYSAEARGYALAGLLALAAFLTLERHLTSRGWLSAGLFGLLCALGFLSHLTFIHFYVGAISWSAARLAKESTSWRRRAGAMLRCHVLPILFFVAFYFVSLRGLDIGGGDSPHVFLVVVKSLAVAVGGPLSFSASQLTIAFFAACGGIAALGTLARARLDVWILFAVTIYLSPLFLLVQQPESGLFVRYFYINILFYLLLISYLLGRIASAGVVGSVTTAAVMMLMLFGNIERLREFSHGRRGEYQSAVRYIVDHSTEPQIGIGVDHARTRLTLHFLSVHAPPGHSLLYGEAANKPSATDQWYIAHNEQQGFTFAAVIEDAEGRRFELANVCRHAGLSGFDWAVYRRVESTAPEPAR